MHVPSTMGDLCSRELLHSMFPASTRSVSLHLAMTEYFVNRPVQQTSRMSVDALKEHVRLCMEAGRLHEAEISGRPPRSRLEMASRP